MSPAALVPVGGVSRAGHLSAFSSSHHFLGTISAIGAWIHKNLSMSCLPATSSTRLGT